MGIKLYHTLPSHLKVFENIEFLESALKLFLLQQTYSVEK
jgi:hypothetical protein